MESGLSLCQQRPWELQLGLRVVPDAQLVADTKSAIVASAPTIGIERATGSPYSPERDELMGSQATR